MTRGPAARAARAKRTQAGWTRASSLLALGGILALTFAVYVPSLKNGFTNWDDNFYVTENPLLAHPDFHAVVTTPVAGNYHPLTIWSLALNYRLSRLDPASYHWLNLLLHLANTALVFFFVLRLSKGRFWTPIVTAIFFGIHPLHVESVAWIAERKDVLYSLFYLAGLICYLRYIDGKRPIWLPVTFGLFVLSVASKPSAVVFPITLLAIDYFRHRRFTVRSLSEKVPFFAVSVVGGLLTLGAQKAGGAIAEQWTLWQRVCFASYGALMYVVKLFLPFRLAAIYPYPMVSGVPLSPKYAASFVALLVLVPALILLFRRVRVVMFGLAFYAINVALVLQLATVGGAVMADRYTYLPYVGLLLALSWWLDEPVDRVRFGRIVRPALAAIFAVLLPISLVQTWKRCQVWRNAETLWNDTIAKYPGQIADAYNDRGYYYYHDAHRYQEAVADFSTAIRLNSTIAKFWLNKGNALAALNQNDSAFVCFERTLALRPNDADAWNNRAGIKLRRNDLPGALADYTRAIELAPRHRDARANRAMVEIMMRRFEPAIEDSRRAIELDPANSANYLQLGSIGYALQQLGHHREAIAEFDDAIRSSPSGEPRLGAYHLYRSFSYSVLGDTTSALRDALEAKRLGATVDAGYLQRLGG